MAVSVGNTMSPTTAPLYPSMDFYPTSAIQTFPPPLPANRQSLRSRCGVTMRLQLTTNGLTSPVCGRSPKVHVQPHRNNLPRRRNIKRIVIRDPEDDVEATVESKVNEVEPKAQEVPIKIASPVHVQPCRDNLPRRRKVNRIVVHDTDDDFVNTTKTLEPAARVQSVSHPAIEGPFVPIIPANDAQLQTIVPRVSMAFADITSDLESLPGYSSAEPYTHIVRIGYGDNSEGAVKRENEGRTQYCDLYLPESARANGPGRAGLALTDAQLRTARDFMAEALPQLVQGSASGIRLLVAGPHGRPTDVVSVTACYFAFVSGKSMEDVLLFIDAEDEFLSVWKGEVSEEEAEKVGKIAQAWSWLSAIVRPQVNV